MGNGIAELENQEDYMLLLGGAGLCRLEKSGEQWNVLYTFSGEGEIQKVFESRETAIADVHRTDQQRREEMRKLYM